MSQLTVSIDAMGGDAGPGVVVAALSRSAVRHPGVHFLLHGDEALLKPLLGKKISVKPAALFCSETAWHIGDAAVPDWTLQR